MKFAFLIHYLSDETRSLMQLDRGGPLRSHWGLNVLEFCSSFRQTGIPAEPTPIAYTEILLVRRIFRTSA